MTWRYTIMADQMNSTGTLLEACRSGMADPRLCMFSENSLAYTKTPVFAINSVINFFSMEKLRPYFNASVPYPPDWIACDRSTCRGIRHGRPAWQPDGREPMPIHPFPLTTQQTEPCSGNIATRRSGKL
jgi:hypothetical protein